MSVDAFIGSWTGLATWEGTAGRAGGIRTAELIIYGDLDTTLLVDDSLKLAELIPGSQLEVIAETAHSWQWERPELFNAALGGFLAGVAARQVSTS